MKAASRICRILAFLFLSILVCLLGVGCGGGKSSLQSHLESAARYIDAGKLGRAKTEIDAAIRLDPSRSFTYRTAAGLYSGRYPAESAAVMQDLLRRNKSGVIKPHLSRDERAGVYTSIGMFWQSANKPHEAESALKAALDLFPDNATALNALGYFYADEGIKLQESKRLIERALELTPGDWAITDSLGWVQYKLGNYDAAITTLRKAVESAPNEAELRYHLGAAYLKRGKRTAAAIELQKTLVLDCNMKEATTLLKSLQK